MFVETYTSTINEDKNLKIKLAFIKSLNVQAFPCGRRRSTKLGEAESDPRIPFDPEARLNTEVNNRKHTGLNGFTQTYLSSWKDGDGANQLIVSLAGYLFNIKLDSTYQSYDNFGDEVTNALASDDSEIDSIYINILMEETPLFSATERNLIYNTNILGSLRPSNDLTALDLPISGKERSQDSDDYYFSGLAFSAYPLTEILRESYKKEEGAFKGEFKTRDSFPFIANENTNNQTNKCAVSLHLLEKKEGKWKIHEPARLPNIEHGPTSDSIKTGDIYAENLYAGDITPNDTKTTDLSVSNKASIKDLEVSNLILAETIGEINNSVTNIYATNANIANVTADKLDVNTVSADKLEQNIAKDGKTNICPVPAIFIKPQTDGNYKFHK